MISSTRRDDYVHNLQNQLNNLQDEIYKLSRNNVINREKLSLIGELDAIKSKISN